MSLITLHNEVNMKQAIKQHNLSITFLFIERVYEEQMLARKAV